MFFSFRVWAQETPSQQPTKVTPELESELVQAEQEMTSRLKELESLREEQKAIEQSIEDARALLTEAVMSNDTVKKTKAEDTLRTVGESLSTIDQKIAHAQQLYDQAAERYRIENESVKLIKEATPSDAQKTRVKEVTQKKTLAERAEKEAELAENKVTTLQKEHEILIEQQKRLLEDIDKINTQIDNQNLTRNQRSDLLKRRQDLIAKQKELEAKVFKLGQELVAAKVERRIKTDKAAEEAIKYEKWQKNIIKSFVFLTAVVILLMLLRMVVSSRIRDSQRRYYINRSLSILTVFIVLIGLLIIFVRDFAYLMTGLGVAIAGMAIALQEMIASFFAWFLIQGPKGYRVHDWIRVGEQYGEVVDIGLLVTVLAQVSAIGQRGEKGGGWTGGLTIFSNSVIFKNSIINYTKGYPFMWCSMTYTVTFESNWEHAEKLLLESAVNEEIDESTREAAKKIEKMTRDFAIKVRDTKPVVRTRTGGSGIELTLRFLAHPRRRRLLMDKVNRQILEAVNKANNVELAYYTMRVIPTTPF